MILSVFYFVHLLLLNTVFANDLIKLYKI